MLRGWLAAATLMTGGFLLLDHHPRWGAGCLIGSMLATLALLGWLVHRLRHVPCPACLGPTRTRRDEPRRAWVADCEACAVRWDLQVGTGPVT